MSVDPGSPCNVTQLLAAIGKGDRRASDDLLPLLYGELRELARVKLMREPPGNTLQATALVHEAYLRLLGGDEPGWDSRGHFFAAAAEAMRRILIERARRVGRKKHGGDHRRVELSEGARVSGGQDVDVLALDEALQRFEGLDERKADVVKLRYFAGLSIAETAQALDISPATVKSDWYFARAWLHRALAGDDTEIDRCGRSDSSQSSRD